MAAGIGALSAPLRAQPAPAGPEPAPKKAPAGQEDFRDLILTREGVPITPEMDPGPPLPDLKLLQTHPDFRLLTRVRLPSFATSTSLAIAGGRVYYRGYDGVYCLDLRRSPREGQRPCRPRR